jgi:hypothetical protein
MDNKFNKLEGFRKNDYSFTTVDEKEKLEYTKQVKDIYKNLKASHFDIANKINTPDLGPSTNHIYGISALGTRR